MMKAIFTDWNAPENAAELAEKCQHDAEYISEYAPSQSPRWCDECEDIYDDDSLVVTDPYTGEDVKLCCDCWLKHIARGDWDKAVDMAMDTLYLNHSEAVSMLTDARFKLMQESFDAVISQINAINDTLRRAQ